MCSKGIKRSFLNKNVPLKTLVPIGTSHPKIATNFKSSYLVEIFALLLWNLSWLLLLPSFRFLQIFIIFCVVVLEICDSSFFEFRKIKGPYHLECAKSVTQKLSFLKILNAFLHLFFNTSRTLGSATVGRKI